MKVTITIEDDGSGPGIAWGAEGPYIRGPYIRGPYIVIPQEDGSETEIEIAGLAAAAKEKSEGS